MTSTKTVALLLVILGGFAIWVNSQGKFGNVLTDITTSAIPKTQGGVDNFGQLALGIVVVIFIASLLPDDVAVTFLLIAALAGLINSPTLLKDFSTPTSASNASTMPEADNPVISQTNPAGLFGL